MSVSLLLKVSRTDSTVHWAVTKAGKLWVEMLKDAGHLVRTGFSVARGS